MDQILLRKAAERLDNLLRQYATADTEVRQLQSVLSGLVADARSGKISTPMEWRDIPGAYSFSEGHLRKYDDLETAYAEFKIEITGGETPILRDLRLKRGR